MRRRGEAGTVRACAEAGGGRTGRKPAAASEGEAKEDHLNIVGMQKSTRVTTLLGWKAWIVVGLTQRFRDLVK